MKPIILDYVRILLAIYISRHSLILESVVVEFCVAICVVHRYDSGTSAS